MKTWNDIEITNLLLSNNRAVERAVLAIYNLQTEVEKSTSNTREMNGVGFNGPDARLGSYYARWLMSGRNLTGKHLDNARKMMIKYRRQLVEVANSHQHSA